MNPSKPGAERRALARILETPHLAAVVPQLAPEILHRVIQTCGLEDSGDLVALATPAQLVRLLDLDLWRVERPGRDETFDAARFGMWLEVLVEMGESVAAAKLAEIDVDVVSAGLARHVMVFDRAAVADYVTTDGERIMGARPDGRLMTDVGAFVVVARRADAWDAIVSVLTSLQAEHPQCFGRIMAGARALSNSTPEIDGLDNLLADGDQVMLDVAIGREGRRERLGYVAVADARAFLELSRQGRVETSTTRAVRTEPWTSGPGVGSSIPDAASVREAATASAAAVIDMLIDEGIVEQRPRALLAASDAQTPRLTRIRAQMQFLFDRDPAAYLTRTEEIGYLVNTLMAGCSIQARSFTSQEAWDAAVAACNLGLESLEASDGFLADHDLITVFQAGWTVLHDDVAMYAAERLTAVLATLPCVDRNLQADLKALRRELVKHMRAGRPWRARQAMEVLASLDMPAWAALLGLIDECPVLHAGIAASQDRNARAVSASAFEFIAEQAQILAVRAFMESLAATLGEA